MVLFEGHRAHPIREQQSPGTNGIGRRGSAGQGPAVFQKHLQAEIDAFSYGDAHETAKDAFLHGADLHGYVLGDDPPQMWECEVCGARLELSSLAIAAGGPLVGQPLCTKTTPRGASGLADCPAYGFDLIHPALPDETSL